MPDVHLLPLLRPDTSELVAMRARHASDDQHDATSSMERLPDERSLEAAVRDGHGRVCRDRTGGVVAYGEFRTWREQQGPQVYVVDGYVAPPSRGNGIGSTLLHELEELARGHADEHGHDDAAVLGANASCVQPDAIELLLEHGYKHTFDQVEMRLVDPSAAATNDHASLPIRRARVGDAAALHALTLRVWAGREFFTTPSEQSFADWLGRSDLDLFHVLEEEERIVAFVAAELAPAHAEIDDLQVDPSHQRRGIASTLVSGIVAQLIERDIQEIRLNTEGHDPSGARSLYERMGFVVHRTYHRYRKAM